MPITEFLEKNAREYPNDVCLVEINPEIKLTMFFCHVILFVFVNPLMTDGRVEYHME